MPPSTPSPPASSPPPSPGGVTPPAQTPPPPVVSTCPAGNETRTIILAYGLGHRPVDNNKVVMVDRLVEYGVTSPQPVATADGFTYDATQTQGVSYVVKFVYTKEDFRKYIQDPTVHLIYNGHSRDGRGPCFRDQLSDMGPGEWWGNEGTFLMGFDFVAVPTSDMRKRGYTPHVASAVEAPTKDVFDITKCEPVHLGNHYYDLALRTTGAPPKLPDGQYWGYEAAELDVESDDDWNEKHLTSMIPEWLAAECGASDLKPPKARVLCLFACDTEHYFKAIVQATGAQPSADSGFVYYTSATAFPTTTTALWLSYLFTYKGPAGYGSMPWKPSLDYAMAGTNATLADWTKNKQLGDGPGGSGWLVVT